MSSVCPYLYRDEKGRFICAAINEPVDPGLMPCLADYTTCRFYVEASKERGTQPQEVEVVTQPPAEVEAQVQVAEEIKPPSEETLIDQLESIEKEIVELDDKWKAYAESVNLVLEKWEDLYRRVERTVKALERVLTSHEKMLSELEDKRSHGLVTEEGYQKLRRNIEEQISKYSKLKDELVSMRENIQRLLNPHIQRIKISEAKSELGKLRVSLMKLEQLYKEGKVGREVYEKLRRELEYRIRVLQQIAG